MTLKNVQLSFSRSIWLNASLEYRGAYDIEELEILKYNDRELRKMPKVQYFESTDSQNDHTLSTLLPTTQRKSCSFLQDSCSKDPLLYLAQENG